MTHHLATRGARLVAAAATTAAALALAACSTGDTATATDPTAPADQVEALAALGLDGLDAREIIDTLDATPLDERPSDFVASVRPSELVITDADQRETTLAMPEDAFYVSIAPYVEDTHDCYFHSLTTCTGEIQDDDVQVLVTDAATGETLLDETRTTFANGFVGLWLPRDIEATVTIEHEGRSATTDLSTSNDDDATCITTMRLA